jgi:antitoxin MazE
MRVAKRGNSLAVRLPAAVVKALKLKEGDQIEIRVAGKRKLEVARDPIRQWALEEMERLRVPLPPDFKFNREELYERGKSDEGR